MKTIAIGVMIAGLSVATALAQGEAGNTAAQNAEAKPNRVCLWSHLIDHTTTLDPSTVVFHMRNGTMWKNTLRQPCPALMFHGFSYLTQDGYICPNMQSIVVITTNEVCKLGAFEPYVPPPKERPAKDRL